jgi:hypothetical protein
VSLAHTRMLRVVTRDDWNHPPKAQLRAYRQRLMRDPRVVRQKPRIPTWGWGDQFYTFPPSRRQRIAAAHTQSSRQLQLSKDTPCP